MTSTSRRATFNPYSNFPTGVHTKFISLPGSLLTVLRIVEAQRRKSRPESTFAEARLRSLELSREGLVTKQVHGLCCVNARPDAYFVRKKGPLPVD